MPDLDLDALTAVAEAATPGHVPIPARVDIDREGTCDGCAQQAHLVASYPEPDNEPWLCATCAADADFQHAFDPATVLALIGLAAERDRMARGARDWASVTAQAQVAAERAEAALERLRREVAALADEIEDPRVGRAGPQRRRLWSDRLRALIGGGR